MDARLNLDLKQFVSTPTNRSEPDYLIRTHLKLVRKIAWSVHSRMSSAIEVDDLVQIGTVALIEAARAFEDRGEATFATYATVRIRGAMIDSLRRSSTMVRSAMRRRREFGATRSAIEGVLGRTATDAEMAARLEMPIAAYRTAVSTTHAIGLDSIDEAYSDHTAAFADASPGAFDNLARDRLQRAVAAAIGQLPEREALVLQLYFVEELNLEEIGQVLRVGAARVCQIKKAALERVKAALAGWD